MMLKDFYYPSCGAGQIHAYRWEGPAKPVGIVQIIHGIADYGARYDAFAKYLTDLGFLVVAEDHMGHGLSSSDDDLRGYFSGGWFHAVDDSYQLLKMIREEFPDLPYILFGHSMGSFMAETILQKYPECGISGCVLCGSGWQSDKALSAGVRICNAACRISGETQTSARLLKLVFGAYNLRVEHYRTPYDWVCRDRNVVDALINDPLCSHQITTGLMRDMLTGIRYIQNPENIARINKQLPILLVAGGDDPVGSYSEGVRKIASAFADAGICNVKTTIYPLCRHEILNEINRDEIFAHIAQWMQSVIEDR